MCMEENNIFRSETILPQKNLEPLTFSQKYSPNKIPYKY